MRATGWLGIFLLTVVSSSALAQSRSFRPFAGASATFAPSRSFRGDQDRIQEAYLQGSFGLPLLTYDFEDNQFGKSRFLAMLFSSRTRAYVPMTDSLGYRYTFLSQFATLSGTYFTGGKNTWLYSVSSSFSEDLGLLQKQLLLRMSGLAVLRRKAGYNWGYQVGAVYTYAYGKGIPLPVLGLYIVFRNKSRLNIAPLLNITYTLRAGERSVASFRLAPTGGVYQYESTAPAQAGALHTFRQRAYRLQATYTYRKSRNLSLVGGAGMLVKRTLTYPDIRSGMINIKSGLQFSLGIKYTFGEPLKPGSVDMEEDTYWLEPDLAE
jgi:hypothetical protein